MVDQCVYLFGGNLGTVQSAAVYCYSLPHGSKEWQPKQSMPHEVANPLVVHHERSIYVLGRTEFGAAVGSVLEYSIENDLWTKHSAMPVSCSSYDAGVYVHDGIIHVSTVDTLMVRVSSSWFAKTYEKFGANCNTFLKNGQPWGAVQDCNDERYHHPTYAIVSYDSSINEWKTEKESIDNVYHIRLFC